MTEQLITFRTARLAKAKGFDVYTNHFFINNKLIDISDLEDVYSNNWNKPKWVFDKDGHECFGCESDNKKWFDVYSAPTQTLVQKWLREVHKININVVCVTFAREEDVIPNQQPMYSGSIVLADGRKYKLSYGYWNVLSPSYEGVLEEALFDSLTLIK